jgi:hypothetical protein
VLNKRSNTIFCVPIAAPRQEIQMDIRIPYEIIRKYRGKRGQPQPTAMQLRLLSTFFGY